jgi:hypothetical protein
VRFRVVAEVARLPGNIFDVGFLFCPEDGGSRLHPNRWYVPTKLHGGTFQNTIILIT